ncbi:glycosyltransferase [Flavihumibacter sp.]|uniref:glycosyltransferase n=1 Tax=Flavihumibacter sp. TaxID=1913981 RepID=UPI002FCC5B30
MTDYSIAYMGTKGFPFGFAQIERQKLIAKGLIQNGAELIIVSRYGIHNSFPFQYEQGVNKYEGIPFVYCSGQPIRPGGMLKRTSLKIRGLLNEIRFVMKWKGDKRIMLVSTNYFRNILYYRVLASLSGATMVVDNVEYWSSHKRKASILTKMDNFLYDRFSHRLADKVICISDFLVKKVQKADPSKLWIKIPCIVDYSIFDALPVKREKRILYCGSLNYLEVIYFVIDAFEHSGINDHTLTLVANGSKENSLLLQERIQKSPVSDSIKVYQNMKYAGLVELYKSSLALVIPLRNSAQDVSRFPHKIGEYCAASAAIISTNIGEIKNYFTDGNNALIAADYNTGQIAAKMKYATMYPDKAIEIGKHSYLTGKKYFEMNALGNELMEFFGLKGSTK